MSPAIFAAQVVHSKLACLRLPGNLGELYILFLLSKSFHYITKLPLIVDAKFHFGLLVCNIYCMLSPDQLRYVATGRDGKLSEKALGPISGGIVHTLFI
jgi:hypothetical protein